MRFYFILFATLVAALNIEANQFEVISGQPQIIFQSAGSPANPGKQNKEQILKTLLFLNGILNALQAASQPVNINKKPEIKVEIKKIEVPAYKKVEKKLDDIEKRIQEASPLDNEIEGIKKPAEIPMKPETPSKPVEEEKPVYNKMFGKLPKVYSDLGEIFDVKDKIEKAEAPKPAKIVKVERKPFDPKTDMFTGVLLSNGKMSPPLFIPRPQSRGCPFKNKRKTQQSPFMASRNPFASRFREDPEVLLGMNMRSKNQNFGTLMNEKSLANDDDSSFEAFKKRLHSRMGSARNSRKNASPLDTILRQRQNPESPIGNKMFSLFKRDDSPQNVFLNVERERPQRPQHFVNNDFMNLFGSSNQFQMNSPHSEVFKTMMSDTPTPKRRSVFTRRMVFNPL